MQMLRLFLNLRYRDGGHSHIMRNPKQWHR
jgi:hypothetical protein